MAGLLDWLNPQQPAPPTTDEYGIPLPGQQPLEQRTPSAQHYTDILGTQTPVDPTQMQIILQMLGIGNK